MVPLNCSILYYAVQVIIGLRRYGDFTFFSFCTGVFGVVYDGYLSNAEDEPEGTTPVIVKTVKGNVQSYITMYFNFHS